MPRPARFDRDQILDAALSLFDSGGPPAVSVAAVTRRLDAPSGSIYHRFASRDLLLASLWLREVERFQRSLVPIFSSDEPRRAAIDTALHTVAWARRHPVEARLLMVHRRQDFFTGDWPAEVAERAHRLDTQLRRRLGGLGRRLFAGRRFDGALFGFAVTGIALAAVREPLATGRRIPAALDRAVEIAVTAVLDDALR